VPRPVNLATRGGRLTPQQSYPRLPIPLPATSYSMDAAFMSLQHDAVWLKVIVGGLPAQALASLLVPVRSQATPVTADPRPLSRPALFIRRGCRVHVVVTA